MENANDKPDKPDSPAPSMRASKYQKTYPQHVKDHALKLVEQNVPYREIAAQINPNCSSSTITRWKKEKDEKQLNDTKLKKYETARIIIEEEEKRAALAELDNEED